MPEILDTVIGCASDSPFAGQLHDLGHEGKVEYVLISPDDVARRRFRVRTDKGTDCAIMLRRDLQLSDGAVLKLDKNSAIVVRLGKREWLALDAPGKAEALELGYFAGNLHWKVRFENGLMKVALEGPRKAYLERLKHLLDSGSAFLVTADD